MNVTSGVDWFDLAGTLDFDGMKVQLPGNPRSPPPRPELRAARATARGASCRRNGSRKFATMAELGEAEGSAIRFRSSQALLLDALLAAQEQVTVDAPFARLRQNLRSFNGIGPVDEPQGFCGRAAALSESRPWLAALPAGIPPRRLPGRRHGTGQDGAGAGHAASSGDVRHPARYRQGRRPPSLAVVPRSLVFNWIEEAKRFTPRLRVLDYTGIGPRGRPEPSFDQYDLVITTYGTMQRDIVKLKDIRFDYAILDESQAIKNAQSQRAKASRLLKADHRLAMTGTPVENHLGELWSLLEFLNPGMLGRTRSVSEHYPRASHRLSQDDEGLAIAAPGAGAFHSSPHQAAGAHRIAAQDRTDAALRPRRQAAKRTTNCGPTTAPCSPIGSPRKAMNNRRSTSWKRCSACGRRLFIRA